MTTTINSNVQIWAKSCLDTIYQASVSTNNRHNKLAAIHQRIMDAISLTEDDRALRSIKYRESLKQTCEDIELEMDFCINKMVLLKLMTDDNYHSGKTVSIAYDIYVGGETL